MYDFIYIKLENANCESMECWEGAITKVHQETLGSDGYVIFIILVLWAYGFYGFIYVKTYQMCTLDIVVYIKYTSIKQFTVF